MKPKLLLYAAILTAANPILALGQSAKKLPIPAGTPIVKGDRYTSPSGNHELVLQDDGNLISESKAAAMSGGSTRSWVRTFDWHRSPASS